MKKIVYSALIISAMMSCENVETLNESSGEVKSKYAAEDQSPEELKKELEELKRDNEAQAKRERDSRTSLEFNKLKHDFGDVGKDTDNITTFEVTNTGQNPLIIEDVSASCGCTMPKKPEAPILPGETDVIEVKFHPKAGQVNEIIKTVTVKANTEEKTHKLEIRAFVK